MAGLHFSRAHWLAVYDMRNDAMRNSILPWPFCRRIEMESTDFHTSVRCNSLRSVRFRNTHDARAASADSSFDKVREYIFACLRHLCDCAKLDLFATALAELLNGRAVLRIPNVFGIDTDALRFSSCTSCPSWFNFLPYANSGHRRRRLYRVASR